MLGLGAWELAAVLVVALVVLGPDKVPEVARKLARLVGQARRMADDVKRNIDDALQEEPTPSPTPPPSAFTDWVQRQQERGNAPPEGTLAASDAAEPSQLPEGGQPAEPANGSVDAERGAPASLAHEAPAASAAANAAVPEATPVVPSANQAPAAATSGAPAGVPHGSNAAPAPSRPERDDKEQP